MKKIDATGEACPKPIIMAKNALKDNDEIEVTVDNRTSSENLGKLAEQKGCDFSVDEINGVFVTHFKKNPSKAAGEGEAMTIDAKDVDTQTVLNRAEDAISDFDKVDMVVNNQNNVQDLEQLGEDKDFNTSVSTDNDGNYHVLFTSKTASEGAPGAAFVQRSNSYVVVITGETMGSGSDELGATLMKSFLYSLSEQDVLPDRVILYNGGVKLAAKGADTVEDLQNLQDKGVEIYCCGTCTNYYGIDDDIALGEITNMYAIVDMLRTANRIVTP